MSKLNEWSAENLERAAKFMRELDASGNARAAIELARREQDVDIAKEGARAKEAEAARANALSQAERVRWEEQRKTIAAKAESDKAGLQHKAELQRASLLEEDRLARKRDEDKRARDIEDERVKAAICRQAEEELQAEKRRTEEHRAKLERENMKRAPSRVRALRRRSRGRDGTTLTRAEAEGRIKEQRENEEVYTRQMKTRLEMERATRLEAINATFRNVAEGATAFLSDPRKMGAAVLALTAAAGGIYGMREAARVAARIVEKRLGTPALVRETSRSVGHFAVRKRLARAMGWEAPEGHSLSDVVLRGDMAARVGQLASSVRNTRSNAAPFRHVLFYGPPGTGKTMVAKRLARSSGMDYAIMSGGDVGPLGRDAVTELHKLFDWAATSRRGVLLFIDEADAFLGSRSRSQLSEDQRNALNALLFRTGEASKNFMMVLATNRPGDLDRAIGDRVDEAMVFDLPDEAARRKLVKQYFNQYVVQAGKEARTGPLGMFSRAAAQIRVEPDVNDAYLDALAVSTDGFSGREISKLMISVQGSVYGRTSAVLTRAIMDEVVGWKLKEHKAKKDFGSAEYDFVAHSPRPFSGSVAAHAMSPSRSFSTSTTQRPPSLATDVPQALQ